MPEELVIVVATKKAKDKGGFDIIDNQGNKYLLSAKNSSFSDALVEGRASKISVAKTSFGVYINSAVLFDGRPPPEKQVEKITAGVGIEPLPPTLERKSSPETGMWWGQMGEMLRCGDIDKTTPQGKAIRAAYYAEMFRVLGLITIGAPSAKHLVEEAKKLGATEIEE